MGNEPNKDQGTTKQDELKKKPRQQENQQQLESGSWTTEIPTLSINQQILTVSQHEEIN